MEWTFRAKFKGEEILELQQLNWRCEREHGAKVAALVVVVVAVVTMHTNHNRPQRTAEAATSVCVVGATLSVARQSHNCYTRVTCCCRRFSMAMVTNRHKLAQTRSFHLWWCCCWWKFNDNNRTKSLEENQLPAASSDLDLWWWWQGRKKKCFFHFTPTQKITMYFEAKPPKKCCYLHKREQRRRRRREKKLERALEMLSRNQNIKHTPNFPKRLLSTHFRPFYILSLEACWFSWVNIVANKGNGSSNWLDANKTNHCQSLWVSRSRREAGSAGYCGYLLSLVSGCL